MQERNGMPMAEGPHPIDAADLETGSPSASTRPTGPPTPALQTPPSPGPAHVPRLPGRRAGQCEVLALGG
ncbi:hypothetical protein GCM10009853_072700 [Glycomyces scopariae]